MSRHRQIVLVLVLVAVAALAGAVASRAVPGPGGTITACYTTGNTNVRLVDDPATCAQFQENAVSWNQTGPAGPAGPAGSDAVLAAPVADKLLAGISADRRKLAALSAQITQLSRSASTRRTPSLQRLTKLMETLAALMRKEEETSSAIVGNLK